ncbi:MAG: bifunctional phosphoribosyl-AMP cyclohydrolase/phosphoribosyl-ATP diphosphatase HisIE [Gammaproteobacteria bacterium]
MELNINLDALAWEKMNGLLPAIVQNEQTGAVLMLGFMNKEALQLTLQTKWVTFYSRSKKRLWVKGETSGNKLELSKIISDCDNDSLLVIVNPLGPTCHRGFASCFGEQDLPKWEVIKRLTNKIEQRRQQLPENSYVASLFNKGVAKIAQKVGEEGVEVALSAIVGTDEELSAESADLLFHLLVLLSARGLNISHVTQVLETRLGSEN